ncbi:MAG: class I SAM-dependent methyltransferase [Candidatus Accumulibacter sp.]|jgi:SAM-dependent methyltransferase|nr:class I SAM-dependent methyltransferase [Accumulibacter sp.]
MNLTPEDVVSAYKLFLDRAPESEEAVMYWARHTSEELRNGFLASEEYCRKTGSRTIVPSLSGYEAPVHAQVDELTPDESRALFGEIKTQWTKLGEVDPLWAVLSTDEFRARDDPEKIIEFYAGGKSDLELIDKTLSRNGIALPENATVVEYGCGLGRVTWHLAGRFSHVVGIDISGSMIAAADAYMRQHRIGNVSFQLLREIEDIDELPSCDLFFSLLVLQHNPPPLIGRIIRSAVRSLRPGGVALFQVPTYCEDYRFTVDEYLSGKRTRGASEAAFEMHIIPQRDLFRIIHDAGGLLVEIYENTKAGDSGGWMSNTLLIRRL